MLTGRPVLTPRPDCQSSHVFNHTLKANAVKESAKQEAVNPFTPMVLWTPFFGQKNGPF